MPIDWNKAKRELAQERLIESLRLNGKSFNEKFEQVFQDMPAPQAKGARPIFTAVPPHPSRKS